MKILRKLKSEDPDPPGERVKNTLGFGKPVNLKSMKCEATNVPLPNTSFRISNVTLEINSHSVIGLYNALGKAQVLQEAPKWVINSKDTGKNIKKVAFAINSP